MTTNLRSFSIGVLANGFLAVFLSHAVTPSHQGSNQNSEDRGKEARGECQRCAFQNCRSSAKLAGVSLRQLQIWEENRVAVASRSGRVRLYTASQALFVVIVAELRKRGLSFQRLRSLSGARGGRARPRRRVVQPANPRPNGATTWRGGANGAEGRVRPGGVGRLVGRAENS